MKKIILAAAAHTLIRRAIDGLQSVSDKLEMAFRFFCARASLFLCVAAAYATLATAAQDVGVLMPDFALAQHPHLPSPNDLPPPGNGRPILPCKPSP